MQGFLVLFLAGLSISHGQSKGKCRDVKPVQDFSIEKYAGAWYEIQKNGLSFTEEVSCLSLALNLVNKSSIEYVAKSVKAGKPLDYGGSATLIKPGVGQFHILIPAQNGDFTFSILGTDYTNWAAGFGCDNHSQNQEYIWVVTRAKEPKQVFVDAALAAFRQQGINTKPLKVINQEKCG